MNTAAPRTPVELRWARANLCPAVFATPGERPLLLHPAWRVNRTCETIETTRGCPRSATPHEPPATHPGPRFIPLAREGSHALHRWHRRHEGGSAHDSGQGSLAIARRGHAPCFRTRFVSPLQTARGLTCARGGVVGLRHRRRRCAAACPAIPPSSPVLHRPLVGDNGR